MMCANLRVITKAISLSKKAVKDPTFED